MKKRQVFFQALFLAVALVVLVFVGVQLVQRAKPRFPVLRERRNAIAASKDADIWIAIAWQTEDYNRTFLDGVRRAVELINTEGGIRGRTLRYRVYNGDSHAVARAITTNPRYLAVIGHETSSMAIPASITYQAGGILFMSPFATHPDLTAYKFEFVVRTVPSDVDMVRAIVAELVSEGITNVAMLHVRNHYGLSLARIFEDVAVDHGIRITYQRAYGPRQFDFRELAYHMRQNPFDAVVLADALPRAAHVILQLREQQIAQPIFGGDGLDSPLLWEIAGVRAENTYVASSYHTPLGDTLDERLANAASDLDRALLRAFGDNVPDAYAASGFEAVMIYRQAVEETGIAIPIVVSSTLRFEGPWMGLNGLFRFDPDGNAIERTAILKKVSGGRFVKVGQERGQE